MLNRCRCGRLTDNGPRCMACSNDSDGYGVAADTESVMDNAIYLPPWRDRVTQEDGSIGLGPEYGPTSLGAYETALSQWRASKAGGGLWL